MLGPSGSCELRRMGYHIFLYNALVYMFELLFLFAAYHVPDVICSSYPAPPRLPGQFTQAVQSSFQGSQYSGEKFLIVDT